MSKELEQFEKTATAQAVENELNENTGDDYEHLNDIYQSAADEENAEQGEFDTESEPEEFTEDAAQATAGMALSAIQGTVSLVTGVNVEYTDKQYEKFAKDMTPFLIKHGDKLPGVLMKYQAEIMAAKAIGLVVFATIGQVKKAKLEAQKADAENQDDKQAA